MSEDTATALRALPGGELTVEPPTTGRSRKWTVRLGRQAERVDPSDGDSVRRASRRLGVDPDAIRDAIAAWQPPPPTAYAPPPPAQREPVTILVRRVDETDEQALRFDDMQAALDAAERMGDADNVILKWPASSAPRLVAIDVDVSSPFKPSDLMGLVRGRAAPRPTWAWLTRSGGYRFVFENDLGDYGLSALERAGLFALLVPEAVRGPRVERVEVKTDTRCPPAGSAVLGVGGYGVADLCGAIMRAGGADAATPEAIEAWLADNGMTIGQRYPHDRCPINPGPISGQDPVIVNDDGVYCFRCAAEGGLSAGWRPWSRLVDSEPSEEGPRDPLVSAAVNWVHWTHARLVAEALHPTLPEGLRSAGYRALLRVVHDRAWGDASTAERMARVFTIGVEIVRGVGSWLSVHSWRSLGTITRQSLSTLPGLRSSFAVDTALSPERLPGYTPIEPVHFLVDRPTWREEEGAVWVPYARPGVAPFEGLDYDRARRMLAEAVPGVPERWIDLVYLLVVAMVRAQYALATPPIVLVHGPSGSGKGFAVHAACALLGVEAASLRFSGPGELALSIGDGLSAGRPLLFGDEVGKAEGFWRQSAPILELGPVFTWRALHVGYVSRSVRSAVVLAGSTLPRGLTTMQELARRVAMYELPRSAVEVSSRWEGEVRAFFGVPSLRVLRSSPWGAAVGDAFLTRARQDVEADLSLPWVEHARKLGARPLSDDEDARDLAELVRQLYAIWQDGAERVPTGQRFAGWLRCWHDGVSGPQRAADALADYLADDDGPAAREAKLGRLETADVPSIVGLPTDSGLRIAARSHGRRVAVRFYES